LQAIEAYTYSTLKAIPAIRYISCGEHHHKRMPLLSGLKKKAEPFIPSGFYLEWIPKNFMYFAISKSLIMTTACIKTPWLPTICGDEQGVSSITVSEDEIITSTIPKDLQEVVSQLNDYFKGKRTGFDLNPQGTDFQKKFGLLYSISLWKNKNLSRTSQDF
jgi:hypothetical protein